MKKVFLKSILAIIVFLQSVSYAFAEDYSGRHITDDEGGGFSLPTPLLLGTLMILSILLIIMSGGKITDEKDGSKVGCLGYFGLIVSVILCFKACS